MCKFYNTYMIYPQPPHGSQYTQTPPKQIFKYISQHSNTRAKEKKKKSNTCLKCFLLLHLVTKNLNSIYSLDSLFLSKIK